MYLCYSISFSKIKAIYHKILKGITQSADSLQGTTQQKTLHFLKFKTQAGVEKV